MSKGFAVGSFASDLNVAMGLEYRSETFQITTGDQASFEIGPYAGLKDLVQLQMVFRFSPGSW